MYDYKDDDQITINSKNTTYTKYLPFWEIFTIFEWGEACDLIDTP